MPQPEIMEVVLIQEIRSFVFPGMLLSVRSFSSVPSKNACEYAAFCGAFATIASNIPTNQALVGLGVLVAITLYMCRNKKRH